MNFNMRNNGSLKTDVINSQEKVVKPKKTKNILNNLFKNKMFRNFSILISVFIVFLILLLLITVIFPGKKSYSQTEEIMENAAKKYYAKYPNRLPKEEQSSVEVTATTLIKNKYMKELEKYLGKDFDCVGKVVVTRKNTKVVYTAYLDCGKKYKTKELYKKIIDTKNLVTGGYGLYNVNNEFVFRGENLNNYVTVDKMLFRIVKVTSNNELVLVYNDLSTDSDSWDDRYNKDIGWTTGLNDYRLSRARENLDKLYKGADPVFKLSSETKENIVPFNACIGKRGITDTSRDNSIECSDIVENSYISLLTATDYMNASTDSNCTKITDMSCQNYNYLKTDGNWWLLTATNTDNAKVYSVRREGYVQLVYSMTSARLRPVIHLSDEVMYVSGTGSEKNPYVFR